MPAAVVFDAVSALDDLTHQRGMFRGLLGNHEKTRFCTIGIQNIQHLWRNVRVRTIVERHCYFSAFDCSVCRASIRQSASASQAAGLLPEQSAIPASPV